MGGWLDIVNSRERRQIVVEVSGEAATLELLERSAPATAQALWDSLPIEGKLTHARWAGSACWTKTERQPLAQVRELEHQATSIYQGVLAVRPGSSGRAELFLSYGQAESRHEVGRTYMTPVARVVGDARTFYQAMSQTWSGGAASIAIRRSDGGSQG